MKSTKIINKFIVDFFYKSKKYNNPKFQFPKPPPNAIIKPPKPNPQSLKQLPNPALLIPALPIPLPPVVVNPQSISHSPDRVENLSKLYLEDL